MLPKASEFIIGDPFAFVLVGLAVGVQGLLVGFVLVEALSLETLLEESLLSRF